LSTLPNPGTVWPYVGVTPQAGYAPRAGAGFSALDKRRVSPGELRSFTLFTTTPVNTMANHRAEATYKAQHAAALASLQALQAVIEDMPAPDGETRINWGHVGSLVEINEQLGHLLRFAAGN